MITIGCDPEFVVLDEKYKLVAAETLPLDTGTDFGRDGGGEAFEIRPHYSNNTLDVVDHIKQIILESKTALPVVWELEWILNLLQQ